MAGADRFRNPDEDLPADLRRTSGGLLPAPQRTDLRIGFTEAFVTTATREATGRDEVRQTQFCNLAKVAAPAEFPHVNAPSASSARVWTSRKTHPIRAVLPSIHPGWSYRFRRYPPTFWTLPSAPPPRGVPVSAPPAPRPARRALRSASAHPDRVPPPRPSSASRPASAACQPATKAASGSGAPSSVSTSATPRRRASPPWPGAAVACSSGTKLREISATRCVPRASRSCSRCGNRRPSTRIAGRPLHRGASQAPRRDRAQRVAPPQRPARRSRAGRRHRRSTPRGRNPGATALRRAIGECAAVAGVEIALRGELFGEQQPVRWQFDVPVGGAPDRFLRDRGAVDQIADRDQAPLGEDGMVGREQQVAPRPGRTKAPAAMRTGQTSRGRWCRRHSSRRWPSQAMFAVPPSASRTAAPTRSASTASRPRASRCGCRRGTGGGRDVGAAAAIGCEVEDFAVVVSGEEHFQRAGAAVAVGHAQHAVLVGAERGRGLHVGDVDRIASGEAGDLVAGRVGQGEMQVRIRAHGDGAGAGRHRGADSSSMPASTSMPPVNVLVVARSTVPGPSSSSVPAPALVPVPPASDWSAIWPATVSVWPAAASSVTVSFPFNEQPAAKAAAGIGAAAAETDAAHAERSVRDGKASHPAGGKMSPPAPSPPPPWLNGSGAGTKPARARPPGHGIAAAAAAEAAAAACRHHCPRT